MSMFTTLKFQQCLICYKKLSNFNGDNNNSKLGEKFCVLVSRYINLGNFRNSGGVIVGTVSNFENGSETENVCDLCAPFVTSFCENYAAWKESELRLNWSLKKVASLMKRAKVTVPSSSRSKKDRSKSIPKKPKPKCHRSRDEIVSDFRKEFFINYDLHVQKKEFPRLNLLKMNLDLAEDEDSNVKVKLNKYHDHDQLILKSLILKSELEVVTAQSQVPGNVKMEIPEVEDFDLNSDLDLVHDTEFDVDLDDDADTESPPMSTSSPSVAERRQPPMENRHSSRSGSKVKKLKKENQIANQEQPLVGDNDRKNFKCRHCGKGFSSTAKAFVHEFQHTGQQPFQCAICSKKFNDPNACLRHLKNVHKEKDKTKMIIENLDIARIVFSRAHRDTSTVCSFCGKEFDTLRKRQRHELNHRKKQLEQKEIESGSKVKEPLICKICGKEFSLLSGLRRHENLHERGGPKRFSCSVANCGKNFKRVTYLRIHESKHHGISHEAVGSKPWSKLKIQKSDETTITTPSTSKVNQIKGQPRTRRFKCQHCDKLFYTRRSQIIHEIQHADEKPFRCALCSRRFNDPSHCQRHIISAHKMGTWEEAKSRMVIESEEVARQVYSRDHRDKSLVCTHCGKTFDDFRKRKRHERQSHGQQTQRIYQCSTCGKEVSCLSNLKRHEILHTGLRPFKCRQGCGKAFRDRSTRKMHETRGHHLEDGSFVKKVPDRAHLRGKPKPRSKSQKCSKRSKITKSRGVKVKDTNVNEQQQNPNYYDNFNANHGFGVHDYDHDDRNEDVEFSEQKFTAASPTHYL